jgi:CheY-like chemotaxis protein
MASILIIEDNPDDLNSIKTILEKKQHKVISAMNGNDAIKLIENKNNFEIILLDIFLPDVSGYKLLEIIKEKLGNNVKYIYLTIVPKKELESSNTDGYIQKPFLPTDLINEVSKCLSN